ncbi:MAG: hypothetical protein IPN97_09815 [Saprospiraceae bacterium]|nr:hypothetical protein [Saprospiraceae bacterium]
MRLLFFTALLALGLIQCRDSAHPTIEVICHPGSCLDTVGQDTEAQNILEDANIVVKGNNLNMIDSQTVAEVLTNRTNESELNGKSYDEIFDMYSDFLSKYDRNNKIDIAKNSQWNNDPFFQKMCKDTSWTVKVEKLQEIIFGK